MTILAKRCAPALITLAVLAALAAPTFAAKPLGGLCWGTDCHVTQHGPVGGAFAVQHNQVQYFEISERCLGDYHGFLNFLSVQPGMAISGSGAFSYSGRAGLSREVRAPSGAAMGNVTVDLNGRFVTPTKVSITLKIDYGSCATKHVTISGHHQ
ncbi:MAG: hypothetical protein ACLP8S_29765 [Solirubrobacteraceae bacterium]